MAHQFKLAKLEKDSQEMRMAYSNTVLELMDEYENVVALDADLMSCIGIGCVAKVHPERMINCGIQEANMMGVAAGLSSVGKVPYVHTFAPFASRRAFDQVFLAIGYSKQNVRIVGSDPGVTAAYNGGTHMPFEDCGLMRLVPEMTVIDPCDCAQMKNIVRQTATLKGNFYIRMLRKNPMKVYEEGSTFEIGKAVQLRDGKDVTIIAQSTLLVPEALKAADALAEKGITARVLDMFTLKPIDKDAIIAAANETGAIVTAENHNVINGLASAVSEVIVENCPVPMGKVGVMDRFGQVGDQNFLQKEYELTAERIIDECLKTIKRKA
ncbi:MAG: transketolase family protein [Spartobacteria bacterium]|nr:transketolase family protein [Spartobacteria bacterium]